MRGNTVLKSTFQNSKTTEEAETGTLVLLLHLQTTLKIIINIGTRSVQELFFQLIDLDWVAWGKTGC